MLLDKLNDDLKTAMRARDTDRVSVLRMTLSEIKNARIEKREDLTDDDVLQVLKKAVKSRAESADEYRKGDRGDLAAKEDAEAAVLQGYLPEQITGQALAAIVDAAIAETGATSVKQMGAVMKAVLGKHGATVDGREVGALVKTRLGG
jgi:hypothetical protein